MQLPISEQQQPWSHLARFQKYCRFSAENSYLIPIPSKFRGCSHWRNGLMANRETDRQSYRQRYDGSFEKCSYAHHLVKPTGYLMRNC